MRHTRAQTANRRSHHALKSQAIITDKDTGVPHMRHRVSLVDGRYRGKKVIDIVNKAAKSQAKTVKAVKKAKSAKAKKK